MMNIFAYIKYGTSGDVMPEQIEMAFKKEFSKYLDIDTVEYNEDPFPPGLKNFVIRLKDKWRVDFFVHKKSIDPGAGVFLDAEFFSTEISNPDQKKVIVTSDTVVRILFATDKNKVHTNDIINITSFIGDLFDCVIIGPDGKTW